jgi:hypothetical protein
MTSAASAATPSTALTPAATPDPSLQAKDPYVQRREARKQAKDDYKARKKASKDEYKAEKQGADSNLKAAARQTESAQSEGAASGSSGK